MQQSHNLEHNILFILAKTYTEYWVDHICVGYISTGMKENLIDRSAINFPEPSGEAHRP